MRSASTSSWSRELISLESVLTIEKRVGRGTDNSPPGINPGAYHQALVPAGPIMTSIDSHCIRPLGRVNVWPARSLCIRARKPQKGQHNSRNWRALTSCARVSAWVQPPHPLNSQHRQVLVSIPAWLEARKNIATSHSCRMVGNLLRLHLQDLPAFQGWVDGSASLVLQ